MHPSPFATRGRRIILALALLATLSAPAPSADEGWTGLNTLDAWKTPTGDWADVGGVSLAPDDPKRLAASPGEGVLYNGPTGRTGNISSKKAFGDIEAHFEFLVPKGSNSGVKFEGFYEVQIFDSWGKAKVNAGDCGGVYPRAELLPRYHHIDDGYPPRENACKPPGEWQTLDVTFLAPRFDDEGKKVANARFAKIILNGKVVQEDLDIPSPTGHAWREKEVAAGPILLQADHGPVAFRNIRVRPLELKR